MPTLLELAAQQAQKPENKKEDDVQEKQQESNAEVSEGEIQEQGVQNEAINEASKENEQTQVNEWEQKYQDLFKEKESWQSQLDEANSKFENVYANDFIKDLNEKAKGGVNIESDNFWKWQRTDLSNFNVSEQKDALELVKMEMEISNANLNRDEIDYLVNKKYKALFDTNLDKEDSEDAAKIEDALRQLTIDAKSVLPKLEKHKSEIQLPKVDVAQQQVELEAAKKAKDQFNLGIKQKVGEFSKQSIKAGETELEYLPTAEDREFMEKALVNNETFFVDMYVVKPENGNPYFDAKRAMDDMLWLRNKEKYAKMLIEQGISIGREKEWNGLENASQEKTKKTSANPKVDPKVMALQMLRKK